MAANKLSTSTAPVPATTAPRDIAPPSDSDAHTLQRESTALTNLRNSLLYLYSPGTAAASLRPARLRTRALLRSLHYLGVVIFWRLVRWAKYAAVGAAVAALGSVAVAGGAVSGVGFLLAPPGILASVAVGTAWGAGRWVWRRMWWKRVQKERRERGEVGTRADDVRFEPDLQAVPW